jgi:hypothetical protein
MSAPKTGGPSIRGRQSQSTVPSSAISAAVVRSPIAA